MRSSQDPVAPTSIVSNNPKVTTLSNVYLDSEEQIKSFKEDPEAYDRYCRDLEGELNKRFTLVS